MKTVINLFIMFLMSCSLQSDINKKIIIRYVDFEIMTPFRIGCNNFLSFLEMK